MKKISLIFMFIFLFINGFAQYVAQTTTPNYGNIVHKGLMGIGNISTPLYKLHVYGCDKEAKYPSLYLQYYKGLDQKFGINYFWNIVNAGSRLYFQYASGNAELSTKMTINNNNVGIGTKTPSERLEVNGNIKVNNNIIFQGKTFPDGTNIWGGTDLIEGIFFDNQYHRIMINRELSNNTDSYSHFDVYGGSYFDRIGIHHDHIQSAVLYVEGTNDDIHTAMFNGHSDNDYTIYCYGKVYSDEGFYTPSFRKTKTSSIITEPIQILNNLSGIIFKEELKENTNERIQYGIAINKVVPAIKPLIAEDSKGEISINYSKAIPILIETVKEQHELLIKQENEIEQLNSDIQKVKEVIESISNYHFIDNNNQSDEAKLFQNKPNPCNSETQIDFYIPENVIDAKLLIYDFFGNLKKKIDINMRGNSVLNVNTSDLDIGVYTYFIILDDKKTKANSMIINK